MSDQHEHKWSIASRNVYEAKFRCKFLSCSETLTPEQTEVMLNEHATLRRETPTPDEVRRLMGLLDLYRERGPSDLATSDAMLWRKLERLHALLTTEEHDEQP